MERRRALLGAICAHAGVRAIPLNAPLFVGFEQIDQEIRHFLYGGDFGAFLRRMRRDDRRTERNHLHVGNFCADDAAFETGMNDVDDGFVSKSGFVGGDAPSEQIGLHIRRPPRIAFARLELAAGQTDARSIRAVRALSLDMTLERWLDKRWTVSFSISIDRDARLSDVSTSPATSWFIEATPCG